METLLGYVLKDCNNSSDKKMAYKFPFVSAELLSTSNEKVFGFFSSPDASNQLVFFDTLMKFYLDAVNSTESSFNYTRSGYVSKVLNTLFLHRSGTFAVSLLSKKPALTALLKSCHCKSAAASLLTLITLLSLTGQTPIMLVAPQGFGEKANELMTSTVSPEVVESTFEKRQLLFKSVIDLCVETVEDETMGELHANLSWVIGQVLPRNIAEKTTFHQILNANLSKIVAKFIDTFPSPIPNRFCWMFLMNLEIIVKDFSSANVSSFLPELPGYLSQMVTAVTTFLETEEVKNRSKNLTQTFSLERSKANPKISKVLEILNLSLRLYFDEEQFVQKVILNQSLERVVFKLLTDYPFNNVLHNQVKKLLTLIIQKGNDEIINKFFVNNPAFIGFFEHINAKRHLIRTGLKLVKAGYVGQTLSFIHALRSLNSPSLTALANS